jgi:signal transduction histidine kinase
MAVNLRLAQTLASRSPQRAAGVLAAQCEAVTDMRTALVDLARGIYPRQLTDEGIGPALQAALAGSPVPVDVGTHGVGRYDVAVETALYFCCLEAVQNAGKHSGAQRVVIDLRDGPDGLVLTIEDDGEGFHDSPPRPGVGLANMRDRIEALGGTLLFDNAAIGGARVSVRVP